MYNDLGTVLLPRKQKREKIESKVGRGEEGDERNRNSYTHFPKQETEEDQFNRSVWKLDERSTGPSHLSKRKMNLYRPVYDKTIEYEKMVALSPLISLPLLRISNIAKGFWLHG